jgi:hypothetical protein
MAALVNLGYVNISAGNLISRNNLCQCCLYYYAKLSHVILIKLNEAFYS